MPERQQGGGGPAQGAEGPLNEPLPSGTERKPFQSHRYSRRAAEEPQGLVSADSNFQQRALLDLSPGGENRQNFFTMLLTGSRGWCPHRDADNLQP